MSKVVAFREAVMETLRQAVPEFREVEWYDGVFNQDDIAEWTVKVPAAFVAAISGPSGHYPTGEMFIELRCVVAIIDQDGRQPRDADARAWDLIERVAALANLNRFGVPDASPATKVKFKRFPHPELRHEGVAIGVVEWESVLTIGVNQVEKREFVYHNGVRIELPPANLNGRATPYDRNGRSETETLSLPVDDDAFTGLSTLDQGVAETPMTPDQHYESPPR